MLRAIRLFFNLCKFICTFNLSTWEVLSCKRIQGRGRDRKLKGGNASFATSTLCACTAISDTGPHWKTFPDEQKLMEFYTTRPAPRDRLKEALQTETKDSKQQYKAMSKHKVLWWGQIHAPNTMIVLVNELNRRT